MRVGDQEQRGQAIALVQKLSTFDEEEQLHCISSERFGLRMADAAEDAKGMDVIRRWDQGKLGLGGPNTVPIGSVDASVQGLFVRDALIRYLTDHSGIITPDTSPWGTKHPLIVELSSGARLLYDGNHRWAVAKLLGRGGFTAQILSDRDDVRVRPDNFSVPCLERQSAPASERTGGPRSSGGLQNARKAGLTSEEGDI